MAKSLLTQVKEAKAEISDLTEKLAAAQSDHEQSVSATEVREQKVAELLDQKDEEIADLKARHEGICQDLANSQIALEELRKEMKSVDEIAATEAQRIVADIGVPAVDDEAAQEPQSSSLDDLMRQYEELLKADSRAAGEFYANKLAPALYKENN